MIEARACTTGMSSRSICTDSEPRVIKVGQTRVHLAQALARIISLPKRLALERTVRLTHSKRLTCLTAAPFIDIHSKKPDLRLTDSADSGVNGPMPRNGSAT